MRFHLDVTKITSACSSLKIWLASVFMSLAFMSRFFFLSAGVKFGSPLVGVELTVPSLSVCKIMVGRLVGSSSSSPELMSSYSIMQEQPSRHPDSLLVGREWRWIAEAKSDENQWTIVKPTQIKLKSEIILPWNLKFWPIHAFN